MRNDEPIRSDLAIPPGEYLLEVAQEHGITQAELARRMGRPAQAINEIVKGNKAITPETAIQLEQVLGVPAHIWTGLEAEYRLTRARQWESGEGASGKAIRGRTHSRAMAPMAQTFVTKDDWDAEVLQALGRIVIHFGNLDYLVSLSVARVQGLTSSNKLQLVKKLDALPVPARCDKILRSFDERFPRSADRKDLASALRDVEQVNKQRNDLMHALWAEDRSGGRRHIRKQTDLGVNQVALRRLGDRILEITERLNAITRAVPPKP